MSQLKSQDPELFSAISNETKRQEEGLELIASENYVSEAVLEAQGSVLTNKYAEGYPGKRYYGGCEFVDVAERLAIERSRKLFNVEHVNVQPHSGTQANIAVYLATLNIGDTIMGLELLSGGHLSHGHPLNFSGKYYKVVPFGVNRDTELVDYDQAEKLAEANRPKLICVGASAYSRIFDWARFRKIADKTGAVLMADIAHYAGLIAAGLYPSPEPHADFITTTTHKTLRGPRGGMIFCKSKYAETLDKLVFPGNQGGPLMHVIAAKAAALGEASTTEFKRYQQRVLDNARAMAGALADEGFRIVTGGTDSHMFLVDLRPFGVTGKEAEIVLGQAGITVNKNTIPYDPQKPFVASGIRIGTPAITTRGLDTKHMQIIAGWITDAIKHRNDTAYLAKIRAAIKSLCDEFPIYSNRLASL